MTLQDFRDWRDKLVAKHLDMSVAELRARRYILKQQVKTVTCQK